MATLKATSLVHATREISAETIHAFSYVVFSRRRAVGSLILAAVATEPSCLLLGCVALLSAIAADRALRIATAYIPYGYNALLVGIAVAHEFRCDISSVLFAAVLGALSLVVSVALAGFVGGAVYLPLLSMPYVLMSWFALEASAYLPLMGNLPTTGLSIFSLPRSVVLMLQAFGGCVLMPNRTAGALVLAAFVLHSRVASVLSASAMALTLTLLAWTDPPLAQNTHQLAATCAGLTAAAIGAVWLVPSRSASWVALGAVMLSTLIALGLIVPLSRLGLSVGFVPFNAAVILTIAALRQRVRPYAPRLSPYAAETPEALLANDVGAGTAVENAVVVQLPFHGAWTCTQGVDGVYTHRGILRHAYDFEVYGEHDGALCSDMGAWVEQYYCYHRPVLAVADGTVVAVESSRPDNKVGESDRVHPWGNYVIVQHAGGAYYSVVAHLAAGMTTVSAGQPVSAGTVVGYCGSSGHSPRPHLHVQLQTTPWLGAPTLPSAFADVVIHEGTAMRFETACIPTSGETLRRTRPDQAVAGYFEWPAGTQMSYRVGERIERVGIEIDAWGRTVMRSFDRASRLVYTKTTLGFSCHELHAPQDSVLTLLRLSLSQVPFERHRSLVIRSRVPESACRAGLGRLAWELKAPLVNRPTIELRSHLLWRPSDLKIIGDAPRSCTSAGIKTCAVFHSTAAPPSWIEVKIGRHAMQAELLEYKRASAVMCTGSAEAPHERAELRCDI